MVWKWPMSHLSRSGSFGHPKLRLSLGLSGRPRRRESPDSVNMRSFRQKETWPQWSFLGLRPHSHLLSLLLRSSLSLRSLPRSRLRHVPGPRRCDLPRGDASPAMASGRGPAGVLRELPGQVLVLAGRDRAGPDPNCVMWLFILFVHGIHVHFSSCSIGPT